jgi:tetratricopeptide (TPR) repeat protein
MRIFALLICLAAAGCQSTALTSAKLYLQEDKQDQAKGQLQKALETTPDDPEVHYLLGTIYGREGNFPAMTAALDRSLALSPKFGDPIAQLRRNYWAQAYNRGVTLAMAAEPDYPAAREAFQTATLIDPKAPQSWRNLAFTQYRLKDSEGALATYRRLAVLAPGDTSVFANMGALCIETAAAETDTARKNERYEEAVAALDRLAEIDPGDYQTYLNLGVACEHLGQFARAESAYRRGVELGAGESLSYRGLGNFYWNRGRYGEAREAYARAVELNPEDRDARFNLAMAYLRLESDDAALPLLERLSAEIPDNGQVWRQLSLVYARQGRLEESKTADARANELGY